MIDPSYLASLSCLRWNHWRQHWPSASSHRCLDEVFVLRRLVHHETSSVFGSEVSTSWRSPGSISHWDPTSFYKNLLVLFQTRRHLFMWNKEQQVFKPQVWVCTAFSVRTTTCAGSCWSCKNLHAATLKYQVKERKQESEGKCSRLTLNARKFLLTGRLELKH